MSLIEELLLKENKLQDYISLVCGLFFWMTRNKVDNKFFMIYPKKRKVVIIMTIYK